MLTAFIAWYAVVQLIGLACLPLAARFLANLPDRGYVFARSLGILLVGLLLWLGTSYGLLRNDVGSAWLCLLLLAAGAAALNRSFWPQLVRGRRLPAGLSWSYLLAVELLFLAAFAGWAAVRAHDPAVNHTEQPMDLMFMNGIWSSPIYPPRDPWLAGYAISYYYLGYWLLVTLGRLAGQLPEIAYNLGQACWYGLLVTGSFGLVYNLLAVGQEGRRQTSAVWGGLLAAAAVAVVGNLQGALEWLHAQGVDVSGLAAFFQVRNFPAEAAVTGRWYIDTGWWWWRSSRVLQDRDLLGNHLEVIDEFPLFSYLLGDNHPHVLAMPFALLAIALALNLWLRPGAVTEPAPPVSAGPAKRPVAALWAWVRGLPIPPGLDLALLVAAVGALIFLNTWDFPPYWLLLMLATLRVAHRQGAALGRAAGAALAVGGLVAVGALLLYLPYFLSAQSQAGGFVPNLFHPTYFPHFFLMFGPFLWGIGALLWVAWLEAPPSWEALGSSLALALLIPALFLLGAALLLLRGDVSQNLLSRIPTPDGAANYMHWIALRWTQRPWTYLLVGGLTGLTFALLGRRELQRGTSVPAAALPATGFALLLAGVGLLLLFAPEFVYLLDNFGPNMRMNTVFKFYYQGWLLLGLSSAYGVTVALRRQSGAVGLAVVALLLMAAGLIYPVAGIAAKTNLFRHPAPTLDAIAYLGDYAPDELAAIRWVREHTAPHAVIVEGKGSSYRSETNRISTATGRATLLGWDGHEAQWRGEAYAAMAAGRAQALELIYRGSSAQTLVDVLQQWQVDYVYVGPSERAQYGLPPGRELLLDQVMELVFATDAVQIYRRRGGPIPLAPVPPIPPTERERQEPSGGLSLF